MPCIEGLRVAHWVTCRFKRPRKRMTIRRFPESRRGFRLRPDERSAAMSGAEFEAALRSLAAGASASDNLGCLACEGCERCRESTFCVESRGLARCHYCAGCQDCVDCSHCAACQGCSACQHCTLSENCVGCAYLVRSTGCTRVQLLLRMRWPVEARLPHPERALRPSDVLRAHRSAGARAADRAAMRAP